ncbi:glycerol-3-phosphate dehydrogenase subunit GlpB [Yersinia ruckeri]|uniref:glycerol-3-phosphate dehydrogenase subunit GlpB n=1 Tax=Yersinia ruckeri TaxID=29486 RepID=UPI0004E3173F|nr:glycerol-3-phosphate dehydrogenase subunit GlpB [Yersinia ruckeri]ARZ02641.1 anaerobic glycerol-3-phosphate dehydrogenase subunit B [Yersinia ruckeri]AUQ41363.1 glycerol-3-phosphate dehydrogenase subunit GlpB [Yersinia ruckeri]EKN3347343.1 glycerol-3-phosphate dehydrogenase subunit GlpB [Yersinia ruckeri]EKN3362982.1 glycerol-3-phosphate dehydrogenase subunit GlpB [Yersinia ruckeri]EKN4183923.1 glycerol-3-phosphate dehydrogenase subunit GlpB [Yersinia ruckeri]
MKFDAIIIGGGLAGLTCGIRLAEQGKYCAIVSAGQSALHFSSGSLDLLAQLPNGDEVRQPLLALDALAQQAPEHPYSIMGAMAVASLASEAQALLSRCHLSFVGSAAENHMRITPLGTRRPTWLSPAEIPVTTLDANLSYQQIAVIGIEGFLDFQPQMVADALQTQGVAATSSYMHLPALDRLRDNPSEFRAVNIARVLDLAESLEPLAEELCRLSHQAQMILLPACIGLDNPEQLEALCLAVGKPVMLLPTLPPSLLGMRLHQALRQRFQQLGGLVMPGDAVLRAELDGNRVTGLYSRNHGDIPLRAPHIVLASGSFFSNGLVASFDQVYEPILGLDMLSLPNRADWSRSDMFDAQPYLQFGVKTDDQLRALRGGKPLENLYAIGAVLGGYDPLQQGCGAGVSLTSALFAAHQIAEITEVKP